MYVCFLTIFMEIEIKCSIYELINNYFSCSTFAFQGLRIDEALRLYLEAFRLPGEAPVIQRLLETFTDNWHVRAPIHRVSVAVKHSQLRKIIPKSKSFWNVDNFIY